MKELVLTKKQIDELSKEAKERLLHTLYLVEDELLYKCKSVSATINYLQWGEKL